ncbi:hypothetical protein HU200_045084 [Digitaria exilis]|uniref:RING-type domain-containing protein n=1 Tax=Digitaria exilis TaxID=1010633 RepID=A0A835EEI3_9POAL|nr:hypothetical protein HU200_045084 [Digitaria exilis]
MGRGVPLVIYNTQSPAGRFSPSPSSSLCREGNLRPAIARCSTNSRLAATVVLCRVPPTGCGPKPNAQTYPLGASPWSGTQAGLCFLRGQLVRKRRPGDDLDFQRNNPTPDTAFALEIAVVVALAALIVAIVVVASSGGSSTPDTAFALEIAVVVALAALIVAIVVVASSGACDDREARGGGARHALLTYDQAKAAFLTKASAEASSSAPPSCCAICLSEYGSGGGDERVRVCGIDWWLRTRGTCPYCRAELRPLPRPAMPGGRRATVGRPTVVGEF